jgi:hypothetical protein
MRVHEPRNSRRHARLERHPRQDRRISSQLDIFVTCGGHVVVSANGQTILNYVDPNPPYAEGWVNLGINAGGTGSAHAEYDNFVVDAYAAVNTEAVTWSAVKAMY